MSSLAVWLSILTNAPNPSPLEMITVKLQRKDDEDHLLIMDVPRNICLRDLQKKLCVLYKQRFPKMMAILEVQGDVFDGFEESPFVAVQGEEVEATVSFMENRFDPFFYDWIDRREKKASLEEEMLWEDEKENAITDLALDDWICARRSATEQIDVASLPPWPADS